MTPDGGAAVSPPGQCRTRTGVISMTTRSKNSGSPKRCLTSLAMAGSLARHSGSSRSQAVCGSSSSSTRPRPCTVARAKGCAGMPTGSDSATDTFGLARMWSSLREKSTAEVIEITRPS